MQSNIAMGRYADHIIKDAEEQIKDVLSANPGKEVTKKDLLNLTTLNQSSIYRATLRLKAKKEIKIIRRGQRTSYIIIDPIKIDVILGATLFGKSSIQKLLNFRVPIITDEVHYRSTQDSDDNNDLVTVINKNTKFFEPKFITEIDDIEKFLFEFSNRVGAFIVYTILTSMHPDNELFKKVSVNKRDKIVTEWINNSISSIVLNMIKRYFNEEAYKSLKKYPIGYEEKLKFMNKKSVFTFEKQNAKLLMDGFSRLYPSIFERLQDIRINLINAISSNKNFEQEVVDRWNNCNHEFVGEPKETLYGYGKICKKCNLFKSEKIKRERAKR
ncbi:MAG: hypothetical protein ACR2F1_00400 [Nitrososphaeraceae archaeon]